ncbi:MAG TPA: M28 family peptidase [Thermoanaerobaculia bacterium]|nr:M28 family peptidase [Thermoanaerobaculia bacterium]
MNPLRSFLALGLMAALPALAAATTASKTPKEAAPAPVARGMALLSGKAMSAHDQFLASDLLEGRGPGTRGDEIAQQYIAAQFEAYGLQPAGDGGTYYQNVALLGIATDRDKSSLSFTKDGATIAGPLTFGAQIVGQNQTQTESDTLDSDLVFVGHGVVAPEYQWDDYKGLDTHGKTLVMLVDDPPANEQEPDLFKGKTRTYYGRWTYKYEIGTAKNAAGVILIHTTPAAGYGWNVVSNSWGGENSFMKNKPGAPALHFAGWMTEEVARQLFKAAGQDLDALTQQAASRTFKPVPLGVKLTGTIASKLRSFNTTNVVAKLEGSDPKLRDEAILYSAHHDHLGIGPADKSGDTIYNGALDNASGCAILMEMARVWTRMPSPKRSVYFAAVAAEEQGLIGSAFLAQNPPIPSGRIALGMNYDMIPELGRVRDVNMNGIERTTFYSTAQRITKALGLTIIPDPEPEQGHYYRSDHFSFGKVGIPAFSVDPGQDVIGKPKGFGAAWSKEFRADHYHQPSDQFDPNWDWSEAVQMAQLGIWMGWDAANAATMPNWNTGDEFRAARDRATAAAR